MKNHTIEASLITKGCFYGNKYTWSGEQYKIDCIIKSCENIDK